MDRRKMITALALIALSIGLLVWNFEDKPQQRFFRNEGNVFGTVYHIQYEYDRDLLDTVLVCLNQVDSALSMFNPSSIITRINRNENVRTNGDFETVFLHRDIFESPSLYVLVFTPLELMNNFRKS